MVRKISSIDITKEKILIKLSIASEGEKFEGLEYDKEELEEIIIYDNYGHNMFNLEIKEKTRIKIDTLNGFEFRDPSFEDGKLRLKWIQVEIR